MKNGSAQASILVVDDTPENIDVLKGVLLPHYQLKVATRGGVALRIAAADPSPDLILLDIMMPEMDGYEVCRRLKADPATAAIPVIFVTAKGEVRDEQYGLSLGAADYLVKPLHPAIVLARVGVHIALYRQQCHLEELVHERTRQLEESNRLLEQNCYAMAQQLGRAAEYRDNQTGTHVMRVSHFSHLLALAAGMEAAAAELLMHASMLHDVGKIGLPDEILLKAGELDAAEIVQVQRHSAIGAEIIGEQEGELLQTAREIALSHHERWDGSGYPAGLAGEAIPLTGRIVAVADVFDALVSDRPYKPAWGLDRALGLIAEEAGRQFDPRLAVLFVGLRSELAEVIASFRDVAQGRATGP